MPESLSQGTLKSFLKSSLLSPLASPISSFLRGKASVLCYHRLSELRYTGKGFFPNIYLCVRDDFFEQQMKYISERMEVASLCEIVNTLGESKPYRHQVGVSFDDGYRDNLQLALPILERYKIPATIFVSTGLINRKASLWWEELGFLVTHSRNLKFEWDGGQYDFLIESDESKSKVYLELNRLFKRLSAKRQTALLGILRPQCPIQFSYDDLLLSWSELEGLSKHPLITLACHTVSHPILSNETAQEALTEMKESQEELSKRIGLSVDQFAYPVGGKEEAAEREFELAAEAGFKASFTTRTGHLFARHHEHLQSLPRITLDYFDSLDAFKWKLSGFASFLRNGCSRFITT